MASQGTPARAFFIALLGFGLVALAALATAPPAAPSVIVISWDGVRHDYPERTDLPELARMAREGARAERLLPVFPSSTFPTHVSLATGARPERHGIIDNRFRDRERGLFDYENDASWLLAEPIWATAERQGLRTATYFWVGSETPWQGVAATHRMAPFDSSVSEATKVEQILAWLDLPPQERPRLILSWWHGADRSGHLHGPDHEAVKQALRDQDRQLGELLRGLDARNAWGSTTLLLVSDHGMTRISKSIQLEAMLEAAGIRAETILSSAVSHVFLEDSGEREKALSALGSLEGAHAYTPETLPEPLGLGPASRVGDLVVVAEPPYAFRTGALSEIARGLGKGLGAHGYDARHPDMAGVLFAMGRGIEPGGRLGVLSALDVAPSIAALLDIEPPRHAEGHPIPALGSGPKTR